MIDRNSQIRRDDIDIPSKSFEINTDPRYNSQHLQGSKTKPKKVNGSRSKDKLRNTVKSGEQLSTTNIEELKRQILLK